jgi:hypothetical protein
VDSQDPVAIAAVQAIRTGDTASLASRLLVRRGAQVSKLWHAAAQGLMPQVGEFLAASPAPSSEDITEAFWQACHGGQPFALTPAAPRSITSHPHFRWPGYQGASAVNASRSWAAVGAGPSCP